LATSVLSPVSLSPTSSAAERQKRQEQRYVLCLVTALTFLALALHGYHPYAEDGGPYMVGIKHILDPSLYPHASEFASAHPRFSLFASVIAAVVKMSHLNLEVILLLVHVISFWITLYAAWHLTARCFSSRAARAGAITLLATWMTMPIAGTSILLMDPYVTARSLSTPCALLALVGMESFLRPGSSQDLKRWQGLALCCTALVIAAAMHPLMAAYAFGSVLMLGCQLSEKKNIRIWGSLGLSMLAIGIAGIVQLTGSVESPVHLQAEMTRKYWFLSCWRWYEWIGLIAPLLILALTASTRSNENRTRVALSRMAIFCSLTAVAVSLLFGRIAQANHIVAWLQPLRTLQLAYVVMILGLGAALGEHVLKKNVFSWIGVFASLGGIMFFAERQTFPASTHFELPGLSPDNAWEEAFLWIRFNTPRDALFSLDSDYITKPAEDAQNFRAVSERSALPDYTKDGGDAANNSELSSAWAVVQESQNHLSEKSDTQRISELRPLGVNWVVLGKSASTHFVCGYENSAVKVCRLPLQERSERGLLAAAK
jgi:hypothetical protein